MLELAGEERALIDVIKHRQKKWVGQILRGKGLVKVVMEGRIREKTGEDRRCWVT